MLCMYFKIYSRQLTDVYQNIIKYAFNSWRIIMIDRYILSKIPQNLDKIVIINLKH